MLPSLRVSRRLPLYFLCLTALLSALYVAFPALRWTLAGEASVIELGTVAAALWGAWTATMIVRDRGSLPFRGLTLWFSLFAVGLFLLACEETSWGQSWFGWETPADYAAINRQRETNLHNLSSSTEEIPKALLLLACLFGGIVWPIWAAVGKRGPYLDDGLLGWVWPSSLIWPAAALAGLMRVGERVMVASDLEDVSVFGQAFRPLYVATRESIELYAVLFVLAYLWDVRRRMAAPATA